MLASLLKSAGRRVVEILFDAGSAQTAEVPRLFGRRAGATILADIGSDNPLSHQQAASCLCWYIIRQAIAKGRPLRRNADVVFGSKRLVGEWRLTGIELSMPAFRR